MSNTKTLLTPQEKQSKAINLAIERLHNRSSGDYQSLLRQVKKHQRIIKLNVPQVMASQSIAPLLYLQWGRRGGKTTIRGLRYSEINEQMPRSSGAFVGKSYKQILTSILPSVKAGLEMFGLYENLHYFVGKEPPRSWRNSWGRAYMEPTQKNYYITFYTGVGIYFLSQEVKGDGRGITTDFIDYDECAELNKAEIDSVVVPSMSGTNTAAFRGSKYFGSQLFTGTVPLTPDGEWFNKAEEDCMRDPKAVSYIRATAEFNKHNLRPGYLEERKSAATAQWIYEAEYLNIRPKFVRDGFYGLFDKDRHCYMDYDYNHYLHVGQDSDCRGDQDLVNGHPIILSVDWGYAINCLTVNQHLRSVNEYRTLNAMYVLGDEQKIQDDLFEDFHQYYRFHQGSCKDIYMYYDNTGNVHTGVTRKKRSEMARDYLNARGWNVILKTVGGRNPHHDEKYLIWSMLLRGDHPNLPKYSMNIGNCRNLYISMKNAKAKKTSQGLIQKDKSSEKRSSVPRYEATDFSDANDQAVYGLFGSVLSSSGGFLPTSTFISQ